MNFNTDGYLEAGLHDLELEAIIEHFVTAFPHSSSRVGIMDGYKAHREAVMALGIPCLQFLDGSFVSSKADPGDIDMVGFMDADAVDALTPEDQAKLSELFSGPVTRGTHRCDAYFVPWVPETHPMFQKLRSQRKYWMGEFGYDREDRPKGIIRTEVVPSGSVEGGEDA
ncbi:DUF6932 family protein [Sphingobium yanoikuyae]|uniref:DUF6932 family protein n=1 Tax=Sphingobium yanoikuyae TaxID=13690 RepID=UPI0013775EE4|nr:hypothetical protein [Sphingobium yanoikuyae]NBB41601.1 hypothetical protein [Sphingobium yanoikuyae]